MSGQRLLRMSKGDCIDGQHTQVRLISETPLAQSVADASAQRANLLYFMGGPLTSIASEHMAPIIRP